MPVHQDPSESLNGVVAPDTYLDYPGQQKNNSATPPVLTGPGVIQGTPINRILLDVSNQPIYWQLQRANSSNNPGQGIWETQEVYMIPGSRTLVRQNVTGIRIRAAIPASQLMAGFPQALVTVECVK